MRIHSLLLAIALFELSGPCYQSQLRKGPRKRAGHDVNLRYIGVYRKRSAPTTSGPSEGRREAHMEATYFFLSNNSVPWKVAVHECKSLLGEDANLVSLESPEELEAISTYIFESTADPQTPSTFWIGGKYDTSSKQFIFIDGSSFQDWFHWDEGEPKILTPSSRVSLSTSGLHGTKFRTQVETVPNRYICELNPAASDDIICLKTNDLVVVVDISDNFDPEQFLDIQGFLVRVVYAWMSNLENRVSVIVFSDSTELLFSLDTNVEDFSDLALRIMKTPFLGGSAEAHQGLDKGLEEFLEKGKKERSWNMIFLAGGSTQMPNETVASVNKIINAGIKLFVVDVGNRESEASAEMMDIIHGMAEYALEVPEAEDLQKAAQTLAKVICTD